MGSKYLIDTNAILDFMGGKMGSKAKLEMVRIIDGEYFISTINRIELLSYPDITVAEEQRINLFLQGSNELLIDEPTIIESIKIRRKYKLKLPDAVVASTALTHKLTLITRNEKDFSKIAGLKVINPHSDWG